MSEGLLTVEEMSEIPKTAGAAASRGSSKGVNLFLARQKLIADMMEQESEENCQQAAANEGGAVKPVACGKENVSAASVRDERKKLATSICLEAQAMNSDDQISVEDVSEIPHDTQPSASGGSRSKGANLFLARQKLIADMMAAEEEAEKAAEEAKKFEEKEKIRQAELQRKQEEERRQQEEIRKREEEKLLASEKAKAARAAKFKPSKPLPEKKEEVVPWMKKTSKPAASAPGPRKTLYQLLSADRK